MTDDEGAAHAKLLAEYRALEEEYAGQDEIPDGIDTRLGVLETEMEKIETRPLIFDAEEIGRAGAFVTLDRYGALAVYRGYVRPEDEPVDVTAVQDGADPAVAGQGDDRDLTDGYDSAAHAGTVIMSGGQPIGGDLPEDEDDGALKPLPERLVIELTAHRTLALREAIGRSPDVALILLLLKIVTDTFRTSSASGSCLEASVRHIYMPAQASDLKDSVVAKLVDERHAAWEADLPLGDDAALWDYLTVLDQGSRLALLAHCLSFGINALHEKVNPYGAGISASGLTRRMTHADLVARAVDLDMVEAGWEPTVDGYLNRVPKARILADPGLLHSWTAGPAPNGPRHAPANVHWRTSTGERPPGTVRRGPVRPLGKANRHRIAGGAPRGGRLAGGDPQRTTCRGPRRRAARRLGN